LAGALRAVVRRRVVERFGAAVLPVPAFVVVLVGVVVSAIVISLSLLSPA
jgi:hypothetical protein